MEIKEYIVEGKTSLGIEFGSTRIKAVLVGENNMPIAQGDFEWENSFIDGIWTYSIDEIWNGLQMCYKALADNVKKQYDITLKKIGAIGISGMMHGYMPFDENNKLLVPFRTWRNTITAQASKKLTKLFDYPVPQRWSVAHLYQAIMNGEAHTKDITFITTLAGYVHWRLTGEKVMSVGEASGMFPIDISVKDYNKSMLSKFDDFVKPYGFSQHIEDILPKILCAGDNAGSLTVEGAKLLDVSDELCAGVPFCAPEGDAGTGMTATNSIAKCTVNVSAGTSVFGMVVLEKELKAVHSEIDLVTTPTGELVAMVHCNNCTSDLNAWVNLFREFSKATGNDIDNDTLYGTLYNLALEGDKDCGGLLAYNYFSGEHVTGFDEGRPLFVRRADSSFTLANFMRTHLYTSLGALKTGLDILLKDENVKVKSVLGHGGLFKTKGVGQSILAAAINAPVKVMKTAGEGGAWGIALLAAYMQNNCGETLAEYLDKKVFANQQSVEIEPNADDVAGFEKFMSTYKNGLAIERSAVDNM